MIYINLDGKYEIIRTLQETAATAVILVRHKKIGAFRILKAISKASPDAYSILSEAHLLQGINSSLLPTIYEVDETEEVYYLIEEYIDGVSLREYIPCNKLEFRDLIKMSIEICGLVEILHKTGIEPILYRDMKPEHLILQNGKLRLIDFGISIKKSDVVKAKPLGTPNWSAPEQLEGNLIDERCDVYSVGKVIKYMQDISYGKEDFKLNRIIDKATENNIDTRTKSISILKEQLEGLLGTEYEKNKKEHLEKVIAVVGSTGAVGTTHIAVALCKFFNKKNIDAYYQDEKTNTVNTLWKVLKGARIKEGILYHESFRGILNYGDGIKHYKPPTGLKIVDCGTEAKNWLLDADLIMFVIGGAAWQRDTEIPAWVHQDNVYVINNFSNRIMSIKSAKEINKRVYMYPLVNNKWDLSKEENKLFTAILKNEKDYKNIIK